MRILFSLFFIILFSLFSGFGCQREIFSEKQKMPALQEMGDTPTILFPIFEDDSSAAHLDTDRDDLPDIYEKTLGTSPENADTDGDGVADGLEVQAGLDPLRKNTDEEKIERGIPLSQENEE